MGLDVNVVCRNYREDRVIPRFSRYLSDHLGWEVTAGPVTGADVYYLSGYFEIQMVKGELKSPVAAYFTHREIDPPGNAKAKLFDRVAGLVDLRIVTAAMYAEELLKFGDTVQVFPPIERHLFTIPKRAQNKKMTCGFWLYLFKSSKGRAVGSGAGQVYQWATGQLGGFRQGWPVKTIRYPWGELPSFYQSLDVLVVTATVEGVPMPPLEVLSCGGSIVIPRGVGLLDELPDLPGIHRYKKGDLKSLSMALDEALDMRASVNRQALREVTLPFSILAWCDLHRAAFEELFS